MTALAQDLKIATDSTALHARHFHLMMYSYNCMPSSAAYACNVGCIIMQVPSVFMFQLHAVLQVKEHDLQTMTRGWGQPWHDLTLCPRWEPAAGLSAAPCCLLGQPSQSMYNHCASSVCRTILPAAFHYCHSWRCLPLCESSGICACELSWTDSSRTSQSAAISLYQSVGQLHYRCC